MFVSDKIVFLELHKTGCTHIRNLLMKLVGGELRGKHNRVPPREIRPDRAFFGSVRNPWEWYVSLWAYGCDERGGLYRFVTHSTPVAGYGWKENPVRAALTVSAELLRRDPAAWKRVYTHADDAPAFRAWLAMMMDPDNKTQLPLEYGTPSVMDHAGLLTYRYLALFCRPPLPESTPGMDTDSLVDFDRKQCFITHFIRNERLEDDFIDALRNARVEIAPEDEAWVRSLGRTNESSRSRPPSFYYDAESAALVAAKERVIVERFGYEAPR